MEDNYTIRTYKYSINFLFYRHYADSRPYKIRTGGNNVLPGIQYSLITIFLGFWGVFGLWGARNSVKALGINFSGGLDYTKELTELDYEEDTIYVYNNLPRSTYEKVTIDDIAVLLELQDQYTAPAKSIATDENVNYLLGKLDMIGIDHLDNTDLNSFLTVLEQLQSKKRELN